MAQFFKYVFASIVGLMITFVVLFFALLGLVMVAESSKDEVKVKANSVLKINFNHSVKELTQKDPFQELGLPINRENPMELKEVKELLANAKEDDRIKGIYLDLNYTNTGYAILEEIRNALLDFKESGKFIYTYSKFMSEDAYYLASVSDQTFLHPRGLLEFNGFTSQQVFFKKLFENLGIEPQIFRVGEYKSAVEPFIQQEMSEASRKQTQSYLESMYRHYLDKITEATQLPSDRLRSISDSMLVRNAGDALRFQLLQDTLYYDQFEQALKDKLALEEDDKINFISYNKYSQAQRVITPHFSDNKVAVVTGEGEIVGGNGSFGKIGGEKLAGILRKLRNDDKIKAVVLRINSPGGSALASDVMWREVELLKKEKPVIASMSNVAASGGYYMAMACDTIVAHPNTITGSIGIFAMLFQTNKFFENKIGITFDGVNTGLLSDIGNPNKEFSQLEKDIIQSIVDEGYEDFTSKAAQGRHMSLDSLKKLAAGRVWTGEQAKTNGLVDVLGGLEEAVAIAAQKAGVKEDYQVTYYPRKKSFLESLLDDSATQLRQYFLKQELGEFYPVYQTIDGLKYKQGVQARLPFDIDIK
ncbi:signal peptide peptidase SppA [Rapidithrix thailandica]|uniref:Signal peptide peptidase SppA n=1 Tax=Rapidithrix thailandica TaxID=413964 RepID=A0AAW9S2T3_9BACT